MLLTDYSFILLLLSTLSIIALFIYVARKKPFLQVQAIFSFVIICVLIISFGVIFQAVGVTYFNMEPIYFENFIYIGSCLLPVAIFFTAQSFNNTKIKFKPKYLLLFIVPITTLIILFTNNNHHLFYVNYSFNLNEMVFGWYFYVHTAYTYGLLLVSIFIMLHYVFKNSGFFSKQSLLIIIGTLVPIVTNILGTTKVIQMNVYWTPISFAVAVLFYAFAIFKFNFLSIAPIALQKIVDKISDSYIIIDENNYITDFNVTFLNTFNLKAENVRNINVFDLLKSLNNNDLNKEAIAKYLHTSKTSGINIHIEKYFSFVDKYFNIEINDIRSNSNFLATMILFKDITQHKIDMQTIQNKQDMLMEKERLASLGQLIGGISHNLKTPIMSISGAAEGLTDLINEYDKSIGDPDVTSEDHHAIASDMRDWINKIHEYTSYMSDVITAVKGQAVALSENKSDSFTISELLKRVNILMKHEIQNANLTLNTKIEVPDNTYLVGDINSLVQVVNNLITNAIQSYNGRKFDVINLTVSKQSSDLIISVADNGCGMTDIVKDKLFKSMITTKGKNGTGLGMFMSYSTVKGHFNGDITFESELGKGTTFNVILPLSSQV